MKIDYTVLRREYEIYRDEYETAILKASRSGWYILGPEMKRFEEKFAEYMGAGYCVAVNSGTDALILAVRALGIGPGDEVIVPAGSYIASVLGITENGAVPVYVDSDEYFLMDPEKVEGLITKRTKAILPVHMYGQCCQMDRLSEIAERHNLMLIEDCAQSHGAKLGNKYAGTFGIAGCFSFYPTKPLGAFGDGGAIITDDMEIAERLRMLRNYGSRVKYHNEIQGVNSRMDEIQAAVLQVGLAHMKENQQKRLTIAEKYLTEIDNTQITLPKISEPERHVFHIFPVLTDDREKFQKYMLENGIQTQVHYPIPPYRAECYPEHQFQDKAYPKAAYIAAHEVSLPIYAGMPEEEVDYVIRTVNNYL